MTPINVDMYEAIQELELDKIDEDMLVEILFNERVHKSEEWSSDAIKSFQVLIDKMFEGSPE